MSEVFLYRGTRLIPTSPGLQGYLTYKKTHTPRTLPQAYAWGPRGVLGGWAVSYERGTPVRGQALLSGFTASSTSVMHQGPPLGWP